MNYKNVDFGKIPEHWELKKISEITNVVTDYVANGSFASLADNVNYLDKETQNVLIRLVDYNNNFKGPFVYIDDHAYEFLGKSKLYGDEIIISNVGANVGTVFKCPNLKYRMSLAPNSIMVKFKECNDFYFHWFKSIPGQFMLKSIVTGSAQPKFNKTNFRDMLVPVPPVDEQEKIATLLNTIDNKINLNNQINDNLQQQAFALFEERFPNIREGESRIGDYLSPRRGKNLLTKDAVLGNVPVVAGGLEPSTYHNKSNTGSPVITISASGANAGFVNLWNVPVWSSDSSFIDESITRNVYFWYVLLKKRQQEIFDSQTGSAQAHIYPKHIEVMPMAKINDDCMNSFNELVSPLFMAIGKNNIQNKKLSELRDTLLPKLMSGEIDVSNINLDL